MLLRVDTMLKRVGEHTFRYTLQRPRVWRQFPSRRFSVYANSNASGASTASALGGLTVELDRIAPRFEVPASKITILDSPSSFYHTLKVGDRHLPERTTATDLRMATFRRK